MSSFLNFRVKKVWVNHAVRLELFGHLVTRSIDAMISQGAQGKSGKFKPSP